MLSKAKKGTIVAGGLMLTICIMMPPWIQIVQQSVYSRENFRWLFQQPTGFGWEIDYNMLFLRSIVVVVLTVTGLFLEVRSMGHLLNSLKTRVMAIFNQKRERTNHDIGSSRKLNLNSRRLVAELSDSLQHQDDAKSLLLLRILGDVSAPCEELTKLILRSASHKDFKVRLAAVKALSNKNHSSSSTILAIAECSRDKNHLVRRQAVMSIAEQGEPAFDVLPGLIAGLSDTDHEVRMWSVVAIGHYRHLPSSLYQNLRQLLKDDYRGVREFTAFAIAKHFPKCKEAVQILIKLAMSDSDTLAARVNAVEALGDFDGSASAIIPTFIHILEGGDLRLQTSVIEALYGMGDAALPAAEALICKAKSIDNTNSEAARRCLASLGLIKG